MGKLLKINFIEFILLFFNAVVTILLTYIIFNYTPIIFKIDKIEFDKIQFFLLVNFAFILFIEVLLLVIQADLIYEIKKIQGKIKERFGGPKIYIIFYIIFFLGFGSFIIYVFFNDPIKITDKLTDYDRIYFLIFGLFLYIITLVGNIILTYLILLGKIRKINQ